MNQLSNDQIRQLADFSALLFPRGSGTVEFETPIVAPAPPAYAGKSAAMMDVADMLDDEAEQSAYKRTFDAVFAATQDAVKAALAAYGAVSRMRFGLAVKSSTNTDGYDLPEGGVIIEGWGIMFGTPVHKDRQDTFFSAKANYMLDYYKGAPLWIEHGEDEKARSYPAGYRLEAKMYPEFGIYVKHVVHPQAEAFKHIDFDATVKAIETGQQSYSSDSLLHHVVKGYVAPTGELSIWPLAGFSLTNSPAEPGLGPVIAKRASEEAEPKAVAA